MTGTDGHIGIGRNFAINTRGRICDYVSVSSAFMFRNYGLQAHKKSYTSINEDISRTA